MWIITTFLATKTWYIASIPSLSRTEQENLVLQKSLIQSLRDLLDSLQAPNHLWRIQLGLVYHYAVGRVRAGIFLNKFWPYYSKLIQKRQLSSRCNLLLCVFLPMPLLCCLWYNFTIIMIIIHKTVKLNNKSKPNTKTQN